jgi:hypothetical protein
MLLWNRSAPWFVIVVASIRIPRRNEPRLLGPGKQPPGASPFWAEPACDWCVIVTVASTPPPGSKGTGAARPRVIHLLGAFTFFGKPMSEPMTAESPHVGGEGASCGPPPETNRPPPR